MPPRKPTAHRSQPPRPAEVRGSPRKPTKVQIGANGTVTNGAVNFAQICVNFAKTISQICAKFVQISRKSGQFCANSAKFACSRIFLTYTPVYYTTVCSVPSRRAAHPKRIGTPRLRKMLEGSSKDDDPTQLKIGWCMTAQGTFVRELRAL